MDKAKRAATMRGRLYPIAVSSPSLLGFWYDAAPVVRPKEIRLHRVSSFEGVDTKALSNGLGLFVPEPGVHIGTTGSEFLCVWVTETGNGYGVIGFTDRKPPAPERKPSLVPGMKITEEQWASIMRIHSRLDIKLPKGWKKWTGKQADAFIALHWECYNMANKYGW